MIKYGRYVLDRLDKLSRRERAMVYAAATVVVVFVAEQMLFRPLAQKRAAFASTIAQRNADVANFESQMADLQRQRATDPDDVFKKKIQEVEAEIQKIDAKLRNYRQQLVSPEEMVRVLETVIRRNRDIRVEAIRTLPAIAVVDHEKKRVMPAPKEVGEGPATPPVDAALIPDFLPAAEASLYKHGLEIVLGGSYGDLVRYMTTLETATEGVFWGTARVDATAYPHVRLTLRVYTLSLESAFIKL